jgi:tetratricopeptide (TPR) repeat protein
MTQSNQPIEPTPAIDRLEYAIQLAKVGQRAAAIEMLRRIVVAQPDNLAAWLWLAAIGPDQVEAEAALVKVRQLDPTHATLPRAEQWLVQRLASLPQADTQPMPHKPLPHRAATLPMPSPPATRWRSLAGWNQWWERHGFWPVGSGVVRAMAQRIRVTESSWLRQYLNALALATVVVAVAAGLVALSLGRTLPVNATTLWTAPAENPVDDLLRHRLPELNAAWADRDWTRVIGILEGWHGQRPNAAAIQEQLAHAYLQQGVGLRHKGFVEEALPFFRKAVELAPQQIRARQEQRLAAKYLEGVKFYQAGAWSKAITALEQVQTQDRNYIHLQDLLFSAYYNQGLAWRAAGSNLLARRALEKAINLRPDLAEPRRQLAELEFALAPQTPLTPRPGDKLIVVGIAEQRMWVFERGEKVYDFIVSTGEPRRATAIGDFEILDKIDVAYAATWNLDMPYWMGIYWAGPLENGIHSLPIVKHTGYKLWDGYLGQRVSYGCVILSDEDSATLYQWAEVGTKVKIVPSLNNWARSQ